MKKNKLLFYLLLLFLLVAVGICTVHYQSLQEEISLEQVLETNPIEEKVVLEYEFQEGRVTDSRDNQIYQWVKYSNGQKWMAQNLNYESTHSICYGAEASCALLGRLYTWSDARKVCPEGWRLAKQEDWEKLFTYFGGYTTAFTALKDTIKSSFGIRMGGGYNRDKKSFRFINQNGNYWTASSVSKTKAIHYNFSEQFKKIFALEENKSLSFSCRCIEGPKDRVLANSDRLDKTKPIRKEVPINPAIPSENILKSSPSTTRNLLKGILSFEVFDRDKKDFQLLAIVGIQDKQSGDMRLGKPPKHKKEALPTIRFQYTGTGHPYVIALTPNESPKLINPLSEDLDNADIIIGKPKPKSAPTQNTFISYFLQQEPLKEISATEHSFLVLLSSTHLDKQELVQKITENQQAFLQELLLKQRNNKNGVVEILQNTIQYQLSGEEAVIIPLWFSLQNFSSSS